MMKILKMGLLWMVVMGWLVVCRPSWAVAGPHFTLSPASGSYSMDGGNFSVTVGVDSGTEKSGGAVDIFATFDATKLEISSVTKAATPAFNFDLSPNTDNTGGKLSVSLFDPASESNLNPAPIVGDLIVISFRPKAVGTAALNFTCQAGTSIDTNIFNTAGTDVVDCATNPSGSYTITAGSNPQPTAAPQTTSQTATPTTINKELPRTGDLGPTMGLMSLGAMVVMLAAAMLVLL